MSEFVFNFQGQSLTAKLKNNFIYKIYLTGEDIELFKNVRIMSIATEPYSSLYVKTSPDLYRVLST